MDILGFFKDYRWLSNFWWCDIILDGEVYPSTEHAYQAAKTLSKIEREGIRDSDSFSKAKELGGYCTLRLDWEEVKLNVMEEVLRQKFKKGSDLGDKLIATGDALLREDNTWNDTYWGYCSGVGANNLGKLLMKIRKEIA